MKLTQRAMLQGLLAVLLLTGFTLSHASVVPIFDSVGTLVDPEGDGAAAFLDFNITEAGKYQATVTDFGAPKPAHSMMFLITTSSQLLGFSSTTGTWDFTAQPGRHFIIVNGFPDGTFANFGVQIGQIQPMPLPPAALLFAGSLVALVVVGRRGQRQAD